jgi:hypothetical protein
MDLPASKCRLAMGDCPLFQLGLASTEKRADHQINKPCPILNSTTNKAMKPSIAARPFNFSVWVWNPKRGSFRLGIKEGSIMSEIDKEHQFEAAKAAHASTRIIHR